MNRDPLPHLTVPNEATLLDCAEEIYDLVWRVDFTAPGYALLDIPPGPDSSTVRAWMIRLKETLRAIGLRRGRGAFRFCWLDRFDQQVTTKFHLDGAPAASLLMLGYEPSTVRSRLRLADYARAAFDLGLEPTQFLRDHNPIFAAGEKSLERYAVELPQPTPGHFRLILINNSTLPYDPSQGNPQGIMHQAEIVEPDETASRVVNSIMLAIDGGDDLDPAKQRDFVTTVHFSRKAY